MKKIVFCADDYALSPAISEGIVDLIGRDRLTATSCITTTKYWREHALWLKPLREKIDVGLHFNLTEGLASSPSLPSLILQAFLRRLSQIKVETELSRQLDNFVEHFHSPPDFIDGHQHIHHFPVIRDALISVYEKRFTDFKPYIRIASNPAQIKIPFRSQDRKAFIIKITGANTLRKYLQKRHIPHNQYFSGVYDFQRVPHYPHYFQQFIHDIAEPGIVVTHPALASINSSDPIHQAREQEYQFLNSDKFLEVCEKNKIQLCRFAEST